MIEKILDSYYIKKLKKILKQEILAYLYDFKIEEHRYYIYLMIKKEKYNESQYKPIMSFDKDIIISYIANIDLLRKEISGSIRRYGRFCKEGD